ncbi:hypothetical protein EMN47_08955 [Prolixibacteraceae bacterium JC049]|nr:hypothetical protein [Prolixibacteraceae bacterium JC049]
MTMKKVVLALLLVPLFGVSMAQKKTELLRIGEEKVGVEEFKHLFKKNNSEVLADSLRLSVEEYMDLFVAFKLKVMEAKSLGYDTIAAFKNEIQGYRKEMAQPYLTDVSYNDKLVEELYRRVRNEVKARHILLRVKPKASPADTLKVYNRIIEIRNELLKGASFSEVAKKNSEDPSAKMNGGNLGYFKAFMMVTPFEDAAYSLQKDEISMPVRTRFGYHLIQLQDMRPALGDVKVAHVMKLVPRGANDSVRNAKRNEMEDIMVRIKNGEPFSKLAAKYSDDKRSVVNGGELPWFNRGRMVPAFADAAYALKENDAISPIITTPYGFHIIKRLGYRSPKSIQEMKPELISKIKRDPMRSKHSKKQFVQKLKSKYNFHENVEVLKSVTATEKDTAIASKELLSYADNHLSVGEFARYIKKKYQRIIDASEVEELYEEFVQKQLIDYEDSQLENLYPDFRLLMKEYHDGILLFNISQDKIWSKASSDSVLLKAFYTEYKPKVKWKEHFKGVIIECKNKEVAKSYRERLKEESAKKDFLTNLPSKSEDLLKVEPIIIERGYNDWVDYYIWKVNPLKDIEIERYVVVGDVLPSAVKTLDEARGTYILKLQEDLEQKWISKLKKKYKVSIRKKALRQLQKQLDK